MNVHKPLGKAELANAILSTEGPSLNYITLLRRGWGGGELGWRYKALREREKRAELNVRIVLLKLIQFLENRTNQSSKILKKRGMEGKGREVGNNKLKTRVPNYKRIPIVIRVIAA